MLLPPQLPQPIDSENGSALSKLPPVAKQCAWLTITRQTGSVSPSSQRALRCAGVQPDRVPRALVAQQPLGERRGRGEVLGTIERQHRRQLLAGERMRAADAGLRDDEESRGANRGPHEPGARGDRARGLGDERPARACRRRTSRPPVAASRQRRAARRTSLANAATSASYTPRIRDHAVLRRARRRVIERLRAGDLRRSRGHVGGLVDDHRHVARADADRRRAAFVRGAHVVLRAGRDDEIRLPHERVGLFARRRRRQLQHQVARRADSLELLVHEPEQQRQRRLAFRRRRENDRVAPLERIEDVVRRRGAGIRRRRDRRNDADGPRDLREAARRVRR